MIAVLHPPNFFAQTAAHQQPALRQQPFVLLDGEPPQDTVFAANRAARSLGAEVRMTRLQAQSLPDVVIVKRAVEHETAAYLALNEIACAFSPRIEIVASLPGTYALDIHGMETLFGNPTQLAEKLRQRVIEAGFVANVAVAENFDAAVCLAAGRAGISIVPARCEASALAHLPLAVLQLEPTHAATFESWGIHTCGELAALPETDLIARIGQAGKKLHARARGTWPHLMAPIEPGFESGLVERMELDSPVEDLERLLFLLSRMTTALLERVRTRSRAIASLRVILTLDGAPPHERLVRPALPLQDTPTLLKLLQLDLETHPPNAAILAAELHAHSAEPYRTQHGLFLPQAPEPGQLEVLLARLRKLLGEQRVGSPELTDDHRPNAFRMVPFVPPPPARGERPALSVPTALRVCRPPQPVGVALSGDAPSHLVWNGLRYVVREVAGPSRVSGQWWSEANWCREEWDVRLATANTSDRICRIAFDPASRCWYMQGTYD